MKTSYPKGVMATFGLQRIFLSANDIFPALLFHLRKMDIIICGYSRHLKSWLFGGKKRWEIVKINVMIPDFRGKFCVLYITIAMLI